ILADAGVVDSSFFFELRARLAGGTLRSGAVVLKKGMSYGDAIDAMKAKGGSAPVPTIRVVIPEGKSRREIAAIAKTAGLRGNYLSATNGSSHLHPSHYDAPKGTTNLEGFLFPATYQLKTGATVQDLVTQQLATFRKQFATIDLRFAHRKK